MYQRLKDLTIGPAKDDHVADNSQVQFHMEDPMFIDMAKQISGPKLHPIILQATEVEAPKVTERREE